MKPAWDQLGETYASSSSVLIADVDCTTDAGQQVCTDNGVQGYPTIKYYTDETGKNGESYSGGRSFEDLDKFVQETLAKKCDPKTKTDCDDQEKAYIDKWAAKDKAAELKRLEQTKGGDMKADKRKWLIKRIALLQGMLGAKSEL